MCVAVKLMVGMLCLGAVAIWLASALAVALGLAVPLVLFALVLVRLGVAAARPIKPALLGVLRNRLSPVRRKMPRPVAWYQWR